MTKENNIKEETFHLPFIKADAIHAVERLVEYAEKVTKAYNDPTKEDRVIRGDMIMKVARIKGKILSVRNDDLLDKEGALIAVLNSVQDLIDELKTE